MNTRRRAPRRTRAATAVAVPAALPMNVHLTLDERDIMDTTRDRLRAYVELARAAMLMWDHDDQVNKEELHVGVLALLSNMREDLERVTDVFIAADRRRLARVAKCSATRNRGNHA